MLSELFPDLCQPTTGGVYNIAHSATAARYKVPLEWQGQLVTFSSQTSDLFITFGDGGCKVGTTEYAQVTSEVIAPNWGSGFIIPAGAMVSFPISREFSHFCVVSSAASGAWSVFRNSGYPTFGEKHPELSLYPRDPSLWLNFGDYKRLGISSGIASAQAIGQNLVQSGGRSHYLFSESTNKPALNDAVAAGSGLMRPAAAFTAGSSHKLVCADAVAASIFGGTSDFTLIIPVRRGATGAVHTLFAVATDGSANGYWNLALDASDDIIVTRVDTDGSSSTSTYATTVGTTPIYITLVYTSGTPTMYVNGASVSLTGTATGNVGTLSKISIGARIINTSTYANYATAEIPEVIAYNNALGTDDLAKVHAWMQRRYGL